MPLLAHKDGEGQWNFPALLCVNIVTSTYFSILYLDSNRSHQTLCQESTVPPCGNGAERSGKDTRNPVGT